MGGGKKEDTRIVIECVLGPVAVVQVPVHDQYPFQSVCSLCVRRGDRHIVEEAETHAAIVFCVVARGTDEGKDGARGQGSRIMGQESINAFEQAPGRQAGDFIRTSGKTSIGIELGMRSPLGVRDGLNILGVVDQGEFVLGSETGRDDRQAAEFPVNELVDDTKPVRALGMALAGVVLHITVVFDEGEG